MEGNSHDCAGAVVRMDIARHIDWQGFASDWMLNPDAFE
jgi:hypothetical protein